MSTIRKLFSDSVVYGLAGAISKSINIFLVPIYTKIFTPADYGIINLVGNFYTLVFIISSLSLDTAVHRWFWDRENPEYRHKVVSSWIYTSLASSLIICGLVFIFSKVIASLILKQSKYYVFFQYISIAIFASLFSTYINTLLRIQQKAVLLAIFNTLSGLLTVVLTIIFVIYTKMGLEGVFLGITSSYVIMAVFSFVWLKKWFFPVHLDIHLIKDMLTYSLPAIPAGIAYWVLNNSSGYFIDNLYKDRSEVGLYNIASSIASLISLVVGAFQQAWVPFAMSIHRNSNSRQIYARVLVLYCIVIGFLALLVGIFSYEVLVIFTHESYYSAKNVSVILVYAQTIIGLTVVGMIGSAIQKTILPFGKIVFVGSILFVILCLILVPMYGKEGAACSSLISQMIMPAYVFYRSQRDYYIPYNFGLALSILGLSVLLAIVGTVVSSLVFDSFWIQVAIKVILCVIFLIFTLYIAKNQVFNQL
ncbi:MAG: oligosaccharide flippase family protein [Bacteroidia bacterium]|nr:oligosaccharide flippase family protein [Bacteroidia bacterium]